MTATLSILLLSLSFPPFPSFPFLPKREWLFITLLGGSRSLPSRRGPLCGLNHRTQTWHPEAPGHHKLRLTSHSP